MSKAQVQYLDRVARKIRQKTRFAKVVVDGVEHLYKVRPAGKFEKAVEVKVQGFISARHRHIEWVASEYSFTTGNVTEFKDGNHILWVSVGRTYGEVLRIIAKGIRTQGGAKNIEVFDDSGNRRAL